jgi:hypothetical protein
VPVFAVQKLLSAAKLLNAQTAICNSKKCPHWHRLGSAQSLNLIFSTDFMRLEFHAFKLTTEALAYLEVGLERGKMMGGWSSCWFIVWRISLVKIPFVAESPANR